MTALAAGGCRVEAMPADVSNLAEMERLVAAALEKLGGLDVVVANAGIYGPKGAVETVDWDEWRRAIDINLHGTVLTCRAALPHLKERRAGKIIILSGGGATRPMPFLSAYAASKAAVVRFAETLAGEVADFGIDVNTIAPGALNTRLLDDILEAGPEKVGQEFYSASVKQKALGGDALRGRRRLVRLPRFAGKRRDLRQTHQRPMGSLGRTARQGTDLHSSDVYTLRRIVPTDRGMNSGGLTMNYAIIGCGLIGKKRLTPSVLPAGRILAVALDRAARLASRAPGAKLLRMVAPRSIARMSIWCWFR